MLQSRVFIPQPPDPTQEDIFSSSLSNLFTDDTQNSHGVPGQAVVYQSPRYGNVTLGIPQHPDVEEGRKLFAHYLWNAGVLVADAIESASHDDEQDTSRVSSEQVKWNPDYWNVRGRDILELGAGTALPSLISALSGANSLTITDHPSSPALVNDTITKNVHENLNFKRNSASTSISSPDGPVHIQSLSSLSIAGLTWGDPFFTSSTEYGKLTQPQPARRSFDKIIMADCLWMPSQHLNLVKTIDLWLRDSDKATSQSPPCALVTAGFHTGRSTVASFFEIATGSPHGSHDETISTISTVASDQDDEHHIKGSLYAAEIFEVDVDLNVREWVSERADEPRDETKRWCVCAILVRKKRVEEQ